MGHIYLETERFYIRQWDQNDTEELYRIMSDKRVHTYTGDAPWTMERTEDYIKYMLDKDFKTLDQFHGACILKSGNSLIGFTGINEYKPKQPEFELQFGVTYWGHGYATEIGRAVIKECFAATDTELIYGIVNPQNQASKRVMEKLGMHCIGLQEFRGSFDLFYQISRGPAPTHN